MIEGVSSGRTWSLAAVPGLVVSILPCVACPGCWPAYAGVLGSLGLGALLDRAWLFPVALIVLSLAVFGLGFRASQRRGLGPAALGTIASVVVLVGKFAVENEAMTYAGALVLGIATVWNAWPVPRTAACATCPGQCEETAT